VYRLYGKFKIQGLLILLVFSINSYFLTLGLNSAGIFNGNSDSEIVIAFDYSHNPFSTDYGFFYSLLMQQGFSVITIGRGTEITNQLLETIDVFMIFAPRENFTENEIETVYSYVNNGGSVFLISDYTEHSGLSSNEIAKAFGYEQMIDEALVDSDNYKEHIGHIFLNGDNIKTHTITKTISEVHIIGGGGIIKSPNRAYTIIETDNDNTTSWSESGELANKIPFMSISTIGDMIEGKFAYLVDTNFLHNYDQDRDGVVNFYESCNDILAINTVCWLANVESTYDPGGCETHDPQTETSPNYPPYTPLTTKKIGISLLIVIGSSIIIGSSFILSRKKRRA
jgi:hypothetical protein